MDQIIEFLEKYWGYSLFGGVTIGTIITFIITQIKSITSSSSFKRFTNRLVNELKMQFKESSSIIKLLEKKSAENLNLYNELIRARKEQQQTNLYYNQVQATMFKAFAYIIMASKLTEGDKLELLDSFKQLEGGLPEEILEPLKEVEYTPSDSAEDTRTIIEENSNSFDKAVNDALAQQEQTKENLIDLASAIDTTVKKTKTLYDKYRKDK